MFTNVYLKTLRDLRRGLVGWGIGIAALVGLMVALWPTIRAMDFAALVAQYPEAMQELFNIGDIATGPGFLNAELFSGLLPILFITYGVGVGARVVAREEESGTLDILLSTPLSRSRLLLEKAAAVVTGVVILGVVLLASTWLMAAPMNMDVGITYAAGSSLAMVLLGSVFAALSFTVAAVTGSRGKAIGVAAAAAVAGYAFYIAAGIVESVARWESLNPFHHAVGVGPASDAAAGLPVGFVWLAAAALVLAALSRPVFHRRDVG